MTGQQQACVECRQPAVIIDEITDWPWCLNCALAILKTGDPITDYRELDGGAAYTLELGRGTLATLPWGQRRAS